MGRERNRELGLQVVEMNGEEWRRQSGLNWREKNGGDTGGSKRENVQLLFITLYNYTNFYIVLVLVLVVFTFSLFLRRIIMCFAPLFVSLELLLPARVLEGLDSLRQLCFVSFLCVPIKI